MSWIITIGATPAGIAGVAPTLDYRFAIDKSVIENRSLASKLTFSRTGLASYINAAGAIETAAIGVPRFNHSVSGNSLGLLLEATATNLVILTETFNNAYWSKTNVNVTANAALSPAGDFGADLVVPTATVAGHAVFRGQTGTSATRVSSIYAKAAGYKNVGLSDGATGQAIFNLETGAIVSQDSGITALTPISMGNGWWRVAIRRTNTATGLGVDVWNDAITAFDGNGTSGILIWGAQVETGSTPTTLISELVGSTRNGETATISGTGVITGTYTMVEKPAGCATVSGGNITLNTGYTVERVMVFPAVLSAQQITDIRSAM
jgi:hypothetical protein